MSFKNIIYIVLKKCLSFYVKGLCEIAALLATTEKIMQMDAKANLFALCLVSQNLDKINFSSPKEPRGTLH